MVKAQYTMQHQATSSEKKNLTKLNIGSIELASFLLLQFFNEFNIYNSIDTI